MKKRTKAEEELYWSRLEALRLPEWYQPISNSSGSCPWCGNMRHWGHAVGCRREIVKEILEAALDGEVYSEEYE